MDEKSSAGLIRALLGNVGHVLINSATLRVSPKPMGHWTEWGTGPLLSTVPIGTGRQESHASEHGQKHGTAHFNKLFLNCCAAQPRAWASQLPLCPSRFAVCPGSQRLASFCRPETAEHVSSATHAQAHRLHTGAQTSAWLCRRGEHVADTNTISAQGDEESQAPAFYSEHGLIIAGVTRKNPPSLR